MPVIQVNKEGINIGDADGMCCQCIEIKLGVVIIAVLSIVSTVGNIGWACSLFNWYNNSSLYGIVALVLTGPSVLSSFFFIKWLTADDQENREKLA